MNYLSAWCATVFFCLCLLTIGSAISMEPIVPVNALNGINGFIIEGLLRDEMGRDVSGAGDVNGDGFDDVIISAPGNSPVKRYVVFGRRGGFADSLDVGALDGSNGFVILDRESTRNTGPSLFPVSEAGDINGDGVDDLLIGSQSANHSGVIGMSTGAGYVVFGRRDGFAATLELASLDGANGFTVEGFEQSAFGASVSAVGDVNDDGFDDVIIGTDASDAILGLSYVLFGHDTGFPASLDALSIDGTNGFIINRIVNLQFRKTNISGAGDVNGDGINDMMIAVPFARNNNNRQAGLTYVIFGRQDGFGATLELTSLDGTNGFVVGGVRSISLSGTSISGAGDLNSDGFDDIIIGAPRVRANNPTTGEGANYVIYGRPDGFNAQLDLDVIAGLDMADGAPGFSIRGPFELGNTVSGVGDINGDGIDDVVMGANAGVSHVMFGRPENFEPQVHLSSLDGANGFSIVNDVSFSKVSGTGDMNGDGLNDLILCRPTAGEFNDGACYVVFGQPTVPTTTITLETLSGDYDLVDFTLKFVSGASVTGEDVGSFSGRLTIGADGTATRQIMIAGQESSITFTIEVVDDHTLRVQSPGCTAEFNFELIDDTLRTVAGFGACGTGFVSETYVWQRAAPLSQ